ncbi:hypothetical protein DFQ30_001076 [Apophysomyces sp. BC1015]|nr:hypothetical protein DFQ30_001076 [Apophysomyces sp. BC1015]KAG0180641.1 hypothetical protein DFQ29_000251 [Apophysomyces sp. BC1021]
MGQNRVKFSIAVPMNVPSYVDFEEFPATLTYKIKATHDIPQLSVALRPKASVPVLISNHVPIHDERFHTGLTSEKKLIITVQKDFVRQNFKIRKGDSGPVWAKFSIPSSGFIPGHPIPFTLHVQHIAPIRQMQGIHIQLERTVQLATGTTSIGTSCIAETELPLMCDPSDFTATISCQNALCVPADTPPTLQNEMSPLQISYRIHVTVKMSMSTLNDTNRKLDRAYGMVNAMGKMIGRAEESSSSPATTVLLDLPITISTPQIPRLPLNNPTTISPKPDRSMSSTTSSSIDHHPRLVLSHVPPSKVDEELRPVPSSSLSSSAVPSNVSRPRKISQPTPIEDDSFEHVPSAPELSDLMNLPTPALMGWIRKKKDFKWPVRPYKSRSCSTITSPPLPSQRVFSPALRQNTSQKTLVQCIPP